MRKIFIFIICIICFAGQVNAFTINSYERGSVSNGSTVNPDWSLELQSVGLSPDLTVENFDDQVYNSDIELYDAEDNVWTAINSYNGWCVSGVGLYSYSYSSNSEYPNNLGINFLNGITEFAIHTGALDNPLDIYINGQYEGQVLGHAAGRDYNLLITVTAGAGEVINNMELMGSNDGFLYDNLSYGGNAVPEPANIIFLGLAVLFLLKLKK